MYAEPTPGEFERLDSKVEVCMFSRVRKEKFDLQGHSPFPPPYIN